MNVSTAKFPVPYFPPPPKSLQGRQGHEKAAQVSRRQAPQILRRSRKFLLPSLLLLCFTTTILSTIYAYCVASRHTRLSQADYAQNPNAELNDSIFKRNGESSNATDGSSSSSPPLLLVLWSLATPLGTVLLILLELTAHILRPHLNVSRLAHYLFLLLALLLSASWISTALLWGHCEIHTTTKGDLAICPASLRNHFMFGIHEVSIAKASIAAVVALGFVVHGFCIVKNLRELKQWQSESSGTGLGLKHGEARMVLEREMEEGLRVQKDLRKGFAKKNRPKKELKVRIIG